MSHSRVAGATTCGDACNSSKASCSSCSGGHLFDAGCGPGIVDRTLLVSHGRDFRITVLNQSPQTIEYCLANAHGIGSLTPTVGRLEIMPDAHASFDVSLAMGVLGTPMSMWRSKNFLG